jgi:hypothetical protein
MAERPVALPPVEGRPCSKSSPKKLPSVKRTRASAANAQIQPWAHRKHGLECQNPATRCVSRAGFSLWRQAGRPFRYGITGLPKTEAGGPGEGIKRKWDFLGEHQAKRLGTLHI